MNIVLFFNVIIKTVKQLFVSYYIYYNEIIYVKMIIISTTVCNICSVTVSLKLFPKLKQSY